MANLSYTLKDLITWHYDDPTIQVEQLIVPNQESGDKQIRSDYTQVGGALTRMYAFVPLVKINGVYTIDPSDILKFSIDFTRLIPTLSIKIADTRGEIRAKYYPKDGSIINVYIASHGNEETYAPIRMDFLITSLVENQHYSAEYNMSDISEYTISATLNVPQLLYQNNEYELGTSWSSLRLIANTIGLGFDSNVEQTEDNQVWLNAHNSIGDFITNIARHAYSDETSFYDVFINPYYALTFVEVNRLFYMGGENDTCIVYNANHDDSDNPELSDMEDEQVQKDNTENAWEGKQHETEYVLTNSRFMSGWTHYIDHYKVVNNNNSTIYNGYSKNMQTWDTSQNKLIEQTITPYCYQTSGLLPLNKGRLVDGNASEMTQNMRSINYVGIQSDAMHPNFKYSYENNTTNLSDIDKFGIDVELNTTNLAITRYSRIKVLLFEKNEISASMLDENQNLTEQGTITNEEGKSINLSEKPDLQSDTTPRFDMSSEQGIKEAKDAGIYSELQVVPSIDQNGESWYETHETLIESLSGYYVVTGYEIYMDTDKQPTLKQRIHLRRKEYKPPLKSDYK